MKISGAKQVHYESGPNMTPLVDVVMVILIFLMLAGSFGSGEHYMLSSSAMGGGTGGPTPPGYVEPARIEIRVNKEGGVKVPGASAGTPTVIVNNADLVVELNKKFTALRATKSADQIELIITPEPQTEWDKLAPVYDAGLRAKFEKVSFKAV
jgi:biopolymer transport protein ExbD